MLLEEFLRPPGISQSAFAARLGISFPRLNEIIRRKRSVTPDTALRLARVLGMSADFWLGLQQALGRLVKPLENLIDAGPLDDQSPFRSFHKGENLEPYDAGILIIDLAARTVAVDSSYSSPSAEGHVYLQQDTATRDRTGMTTGNLAYESVRFIR
jgi:addiction module HigA family antidote